MKHTRVLAIAVTVACAAAVYARLSADKPRRMTSNPPASCSFYTDEADCNYGYDANYMSCYWCGLKCTGDQKTCPPCSAYNGNVTTCYQGIPPFSTADNPATCGWCGGNSELCVDHKSQCASCSTVTSPDVCTNTSDPHSNFMNCEWCQGECKSLSDCTQCSAFTSKDQCLNNTSPALLYPFTCEWCNNKCSDNCCEIIDVDKDCTSRVVEAGNTPHGTIGCSLCGGNPHMPNPPPTCVPDGSCANY
jgi:hypothetical protein